MVITNYDGINATLVVGGVSLKALRLALSKADAVDVFEVSKSLAKDGHKVSSSEVRTIIDQFTYGTRRLADMIHENREEEAGEEVAAETAPETKPN